MDGYDANLTYPYAVVGEDDDYVPCYVCRGMRSRARVFVGAFLPMCVPCADKLYRTLKQAIHDVAADHLNHVGLTNCRCGHPEALHCDGSTHDRVCLELGCNCKWFHEQR